MPVALKTVRDCYFTNVVFDGLTCGHVTTYQQSS